MSDPAPLAPDLLTVADLRELTQLGRDTVYALIESGQLGAIRIGKQLRVPRSEYEAWKARVLGSGSRASAAPIPFTLTVPRGRGQRAGNRR